MIKAIDARGRSLREATSASVRDPSSKRPSLWRLMILGGELMIDPTTPVFSGFDDPDDAEPSDQRTGTRRPRGGDRRSA